VRQPACRNGLSRPGHPKIDSTSFERLRSIGLTPALIQQLVALRHDCAEPALMRVTEVQRGLFPMAGSAVRLRRQIGYAVAAEMLLCGDDLTAQRAHELGLVNHVVPDGQALTKAKEIAARIARNGPLAVQGILATLRETEAMPEAEAFNIEMAHGGKVMSSKDAAEGPRAVEAPGHVEHDLLLWRQEAALVVNVQSEFVESGLELRLRLWLGA
jgi:hypothetical protein